MFGLCLIFSQYRSLLSRVILRRPLEQHTGAGSVYAEDSIHSSTDSSSAFEAALKRRPTVSDGARSGQNSSMASHGSTGNVYSYGADSSSNSNFPKDHQNSGSEVGSAHAAGASKFERYPRIGSPQVQLAPYYFAIG